MAKDIVESHPKRVKTPVSHNTVLHMGTRRAKVTWQKGEKTVQYIHDNQSLENILLLPTNYIQVTMALE